MVCLERCKRQSINEITNSRNKVAKYSLYILNSEQSTDRNSKRRVKNTISRKKVTFHLICSSRILRDRTHPNKEKRGKKAIKENRAMDFDYSVNIRINGITTAPSERSETREST